jgi:hypothetical protein
MLKVIIFLLTSLLLISCDSPAQNQSFKLPNEQNQPMNKPKKCPKQPNIALQSKNVMPLDFDEKNITKSGTVSNSQMIGYQFTAETGQTLNYETDNELCIWIYDPNQSLVKPAKLSTSGEYIMQVSTLNSSEPFEITLTLTSPPQPQYSLADFPQPTCGNILTKNAETYPIKSYPTEIAYSQANLKKVRNMYCKDAFVKVVNGNSVIQIASFKTRQDAEHFSQFIKQTFSSAEAGETRLITQEMLNNAQ